MSSLVYQWKDRSGNASNVLQTIGSANAPTYNATALNGKGGLVFDGSASYLATLENPNFSTENLWNANGSTVFSIEASQSLDGSRVDFFALGSGAGGYQQWDFNDYGAYIDYSSSHGTRLHLSQPDSTAHIYTILSTLNSNDATMTINVDGTNEALADMGESPGTYNVPLEVGGSIPGTLNGQAYGYPGQGFWQGTKYEVIVFARSLTETEYQQVEGYLAWKWGTQANLPSGHPYASAAPVGFAPSNLSGLSAWYDAADAASIETYPSGPIVAWNDISGNNNTMLVDPSGIAPSYNDNSLNGLGGVVFNPSGGVAQLTTLNSPNFSTDYFWNANGSTFIFVEQSNGGGGSYDMACAVSDSLFYSINDKGSFVDYAGAYGNRTNFSGVDGSAHMFTVIASVVAGTGNIQNNLDGNEQGTKDSGETPGTSPAPFEIGGNLPGTLGGVPYGKSDGASYPWNGTKYELLVFNRTLTQSEYQEVEGYVAWKWGLQANLPSGHPYASAAPVGFSPSSVSGLSAWYDASNIASIVVPQTVTLSIGAAASILSPVTTTATLNAGSRISAFVRENYPIHQWLDRSGNGNTLQTALTGEEPSYTNSGNNSLGSVKFNRAASTQLTSLNLSFSSILYNAAGATSFYVAEVEDTAAELDWLFYCGDNNAPTYGAFLANGNFSEAYGGYSPNLNAAFSHGTPHLLTLQNVPGTSGFLNLDGTSAGTWTPNGNPGHAAPLQIGDAQPAPTGGISNYGNSSAPLQGEINEMLFYSAKLSQSDYQKVEGYLAWKWGTQANLPSGHPYKSAAPASFSPNNIAGLSAWYDASDAASMVASDYTAAVGQWLDQSGNGQPLQALTVAQSPSYERLSLNGKGGVTFTSPDLLFSLDGAFSTEILWNPAGSTVFTLEKSTNPGSQEFDIFAGVGSSFWSFQNGGQYFDYNTQNGNSINLTTPDANPHLYMINSSISGGVVSTIADYDGTQAQTNTQTTPPGTNKYPLEVGGAQTGVGPFGPFGRVGQGAFAWGGTKYEMLFFNRPLTQSEYQQVEGYVLWKWGLQANLPSGHPYKSAAPVGFAPQDLAGLSAWYDASQPNSILQLGIQTLAAGMAVRATTTTTASAASAISRKVTATLTAGASVAAFHTTTATLNAASLLTAKATSTLGAAVDIVAQAQAHLGAASAVSQGVTATLGASSLIAKKTTATLTAGALVMRSATSTLAAGARLTQGVSQTLTAAAVIAKSSMSTLAAASATSQSVTAVLPAASLIVANGVSTISAAMNVTPMVTTTQTLGAGMLVTVFYPGMMFLGAASFIEVSQATATLNAAMTISHGVTATLGASTRILGKATATLGAGAVIASAPLISVMNAAARILGLGNMTLGASAHITQATSATINAAAVIITKATAVLPAASAISTKSTSTLGASSKIANKVTATLSAGAKIVGMGTGTLSAGMNIVSSARMTLAAGAFIMTHVTKTLGAAMSIAQTRIMILEAASLIAKPGHGFLQLGAASRISITSSKTLAAAARISAKATSTLAAGANVAFHALATLNAAATIRSVVRIVISAALVIAKNASLTLGAGANVLPGTLVNQTLGAGAEIAGIAVSAMGANAVVIATATQTLDAASYIANAASMELGADAIIIATATQSIPAYCTLSNVVEQTLSAGMHVFNPGTTFQTIGAAANVLGVVQQTLEAGAFIALSVGEMTLSAGASIFTPWVPILGAHARIVVVVKQTLNAGARVGVLAQNGINREVTVEPLYD